MITLIFSTEMIKLSLGDRQDLSDAYVHKAVQNLQYICNRFSHYSEIQSMFNQKTSIILHEHTARTTVRRKLPLLTGAIFETGAYEIPSKSPKSFICGGVRQTFFQNFEKLF